MAFFGSEMDFFWVSTRVLKSLVFNIRSWTQIMKPEFWHIRKTKCFQFPANLFFNNFWFYSLFLYKLKQWNLEFATYFLVIAFWSVITLCNFFFSFFSYRSSWHPIHNLVSMTLCHLEPLTDLTIKDQEGIPNGFTSQKHRQSHLLININNSIWIILRNF